MKALVTGFEPFGGEKQNPAWEAVQRLPSEINGVQIVKLELPTAFVRAGEVLAEAYFREYPDVVLCVGQAGGRAAVTLEKIAVNLMDAPVPDNLGQLPKERPVLPGGPDGLFATIPVKEVAAAIRRAGVPAEVSYSAGTYVCNDLMYRMLSLLKQEGRGRGGFIHLPYLPSQAAEKAGKPSMSLSDMILALETAVSALFYEADAPALKKEEGRIS